MFNVDNHHHFPSVCKIFYFQMVRKNVEKGKLGSAIVGLENKRWITITITIVIWLEWS